ncbi:hypothetical protein ACFYOT_35350 [Saccharothrix saharensis]|uniref:hypothetical protein n=1 Tax=Saccharothrix saharensis TaxID=571190 RepID=UPI0036AAEE3D
MERTTEAWDHAVASWSQGQDVGLFDDAARALTGVARQRAGVPAEDDAYDGCSQSQIAWWWPQCRWPSGGLPEVLTDWMISSRF